MKELQVYAIDKNLVTRTQNRQVQLLVQNHDIQKSFDVNSTERIDDNITIEVQGKKSRLPKGGQRVASTKHYYTMQLATESKAVEKMISESKRPNLQPSPQNCK